jgi:hypothetical protein
MRIAQAVLTFVIVNPFAWRADWALGVPLIVLTVIIHVAGLGLISQRAAYVANCTIARSHSLVAFVAVIGTTTLLATLLHGIEASLWAFAYWFVGTQPDFGSSMLYSLNAMTSYGHSGLVLEDHWRLMGALESLNGWLLFGLTTACLFAVIGKVWLLDRREGHH